MTMAGFTLLPVPVSSWVFSSVQKNPMRRQLLALLQNTVWTWMSHLPFLEHVFVPTIEDARVTSAQVVWRPWAWTHSTFMSFSSSHGATVFLWGTTLPPLIYNWGRKSFTGCKAWRPTEPLERLYALRKDRRCSSCPCNQGAENVIASWLYASSSSSLSNPPLYNQVMQATQVWAALCQWIKFGNKITTDLSLLNPR